MYFEADSATAWCTLHLIYKIILLSLSDNPPLIIDSLIPLDMLTKSLPRHAGTNESCILLGYLLPVWVQTWCILSNGCINVYLRHNLT